MKLLKRLNKINWLKQCNPIQTVDASNLVKKANYSTKISEIKKNPDHSNYITTTEFNKLTAKSFAARLKEVKLSFKGDINNLLKEI